MRFEKWEGLGNDFILIEGEVSPEQARAWCDRRHGIGADGVLIVSAAPARMVVLNADGTRPEMCGNGLRCVAGFLAERNGLAAGELAIATDAGERRCWFERLAPGEFRVSATMGTARFNGELRHVHAGHSLRFVLVDVGNPHAVCFAPLADALDAIAAAVEDAVPGGINVEMCAVDDQRLEVVVWERGVGRTLACGTGACAAAAAAVEQGLVDAPVVVELPGGELVVDVDESFALRMTGPARRAFVGEI